MTYVGTERSIIPLLEEHFEILPALWERRLGCLYDTVWTMRDLADHDERIAAHSDALVLAGEDSATIVEPGLTGDEVPVVLAAGYVTLLRQEEACLRLVLDTFKKAEGPILDGLRLALCHGANAQLLPDLAGLVSSAPAPVGAAAAEVLAFQGQIVPSAAVRPFFASTEAGVRESAWRWARYAAGATGEPAPGLDWLSLFAAGFADTDGGAHSACLEAAAWTRFSGLLEHLRLRVQTPGVVDRPALLLLAALGGANDVDIVSMVGSQIEVGLLRFEVLAGYGHPQTVEMLLREMGNSDPRAAAAAAGAFRRMTGLDVTSQARVPAETVADPFEQEFVDEIHLPDVAAAQEHWARLAKPFAASIRWSRGIDVSKDVAPPVLQHLDLRARRESILRSRAGGTWPGTYADLERLTQGHSRGPARSA